ncbi:MAG: DMT family transporter [Saprospiraceae bacterium]
MTISNGHQCTSPWCLSLRNDHKARNLETNFRKTLKSLDPNLSRPRDTGFLLVVLGLIWGSSFILIKRILPCFSPVQYALGRIILTGICFSPWIFNSLKQVSRKQLLWAILVALMGYLGSYLFMGLSQTHIGSGVAGILASLNPMFTFIFGLIFFNQTFRWKNLWGIVVGLFGCLFLLFTGEGHAGWQIEHYALFMIGSVIMSSITINIIQKQLKGLVSIEIASITFGILVVPALLFFLIGTDYRAPFNHSEILHCSMAFICLCIVSTVVGSLMYYHLIGRMGALYTSTVTYIIPLMAIVWGVLDGESIGWHEFIGFIFILGGIRLVRA